MASTRWEIKGTEFGSCNCDYGCPCQFNGQPSSGDGSCKALNIAQIDQGRYGETGLDGTRFAWLACWPGPVHEGNGEFLLLIDDRTDDKQREAIRRIVYDEDENSVPSPYSIYMSTCKTVHEPIFAQIDCRFDVEARTAHVEISGIGVCDVEPVRNPVTGEPHRAQIVLPDGFHSTVAETASGSVKTQGVIALEFSNRFASFFKLHITDQGVVR